MTDGIKTNEGAMSHLAAWLCRDFSPDGLERVYWRAETGTIGRFHAASLRLGLDTAQAQCRSKALCRLKRVLS